MKDLIEQLREFDPKYHLFDRSHIEAADMLEQQAAEIERLNKFMDGIKTAVGNQTLEHFIEKHGNPPPLIAERDALQAKLSAMEKQEPVAFCVYFPTEHRQEYCQELDDLVDDLTNLEHEITPLFTAPKVAQPLTKETIREAGGIVHGDGNIFFTNLDQLNAAIGGQSAPTVIPLTDEQIANLHRDAYTTGKAFTTIEVYHYFARAIEAAHNIGGQQP